MSLNVNKPEVCWCVFDVVWCGVVSVYSLGVCVRGKMLVGIVELNLMLVVCVYWFM